MVKNNLFDKKVMEERIAHLTLDESIFEQMKKEILSLKEDKQAVEGFKKEENVRIKLIVPVLEILGYDKQTDLNFEESTYQGSMDVAIRASDESITPDCLVEIKRWGKDLDKLKKTRR